MAETLRIEIPIETVDETAAGLQSAIQGLTKLEQAYKNASQSASRANNTVSQFDRQAEKTEKGLASWAKEKYEIMLEAKDRITPILSTLGNGIRSFAGKTWSVTMKAVDLVTAPVRGIFNLLKNPVFQVGAVLGVSIGLKDTIETYKDFEAAMSQVQAISGATGSEVTKLTNKAKEMGSTTKFTAEESAEAFNYMAMAGWKTDDMLGGIEGILSLAAASGEDLATTSDIVTDSLTAFNLKAADAGHFSDVLAAAASNANTTVSGMGETFKYAGSMAGSLGYDIEDVALMTGLMANTGIKATMAGTALNSIFTRLSTNTHGAADAMSDLGIEFFTSEGNARDLSDVMGELRNATADMTAEEKSRIANTIAGTNAQKGLLAILNASEEDYNKLADAINNADGAAAQMSETMMDNLAGSITLLQSAVDGVKISFGERLSPYVRGLADWFTDQMPAIEQGLDELMDWVEKKADRMKRKFSEISGTQEWQDADFFGKVKIAWDEFIAEPFLEWWNNTGKAKFAGFSRDIGASIGTGLRVGIMTLLGIDLGETVDEGASIGASFAKGFSEGFDFEAISGKLWQGFSNLLSSAGKLLPGGESADLSSLVSAMILGKLASPLISVGRGVTSIGRGLFSTNAATGTSLMGALIGSTGNAMVGGSGLLGGLANVGYALNPGNAAGMYFGSTAGTMSGGAAALTGAGAVAGGAIGAATLISSGIDAYKAIKSDDADESKAYGESAAWKAGGVAAGAAAGAAIGSIIPGLGTAVGALVGAGVGGIAGWIKGNKIKEEYQANAEEMEAKADKIKAVYEATGTSIDSMTKFANKTLNKALEDSELSAAEFANMFQESCADVMNDAFGDITLSLAEIRELAAKITFGDMTEGIQTFQSAAAKTESSFAALQNTANTLAKENWKFGLGISMGMTMTEADNDSYKAALDNFVKSAKEYIEDNHYEATVAMDLLMGEKGDTSGMNSYYEGLKSQIENISGQLSDKMEIALQDGVITLSEQDEITNLQKQISEITNKVSQAQENAKMQALQVKYGGTGMDAASFVSLQEELQANVQEMTTTYDKALEVTLTNIELQYADGALSDEAYEAAIKDATDGYQAQIKDMNVRVESFQLDTIADAFSGQLDGILPDLEGNVSEKLQQAMDNAFAIRPDVSRWDTSFIAEKFDLAGLAPEVQADLASLLKSTAQMVPQSYADSLHNGLMETLPEIEGMLGSGDMIGPFTTAGALYSTSLTNAVTTGISAGQSSIRASAQDTLDAAFNSPFSVNAIVNVNPTYSGFNGQAIPNTYTGASKHAAGGYVSGGPQLSWLAEEGWGEFVIPTNPSRRSDAIELYQQAGRALGVSQHAEGGYVSGSYLSDYAQDNNFFTDAFRNDAHAYNETTEGDYELTTPVSPTVAGGNPEPSGSSVQVNVSMTPEFNISGANGQTEEDIVQTIRRHMKEIADELGGEIADRLKDVFSNMPLS